MSGLTQGAGEMGRAEKAGGEWPRLSTLGGESPLRLCALCVRQQAKFQREGIRGLRVGADTPRRRDVFGIPCRLDSLEEVAVLTRIIGLAQHLRRTREHVGGMAVERGSDEILVGGRARIVRTHGGEGEPVPVVPAGVPEDLLAGNLAL